MTRKLTWVRRGPGLGIYADGEEHRYYVYRMNGRRPWVLKIAKLVTEVKGIKIAAKNGVLYEEHIDTQAIAKDVAEAFEIEPERAEGKATNRLTRAVQLGYSNEFAS